MFDASSPDSSQTSAAGSPRRRAIAGRILAVLIGFAVLGLFEAALLVLNIAPVTPADDPFVGFTGIQPLFTPTSDATRFEIAPSRRGFFAEDSFAARKSDTTFRAFVAGGSTVQGRPYSVPTSFTRFLEDGLKLLFPDREWEIVNCGGISYASHRLIPIVEECLDYDPDLIIICTGHNEFLERIEFSKQAPSSSTVSELFGLLVRLRTFRLVRGLVVADNVARDDNKPAAVLPMEVDAVLDHRGGLAAYHRDDAYATEVVRQFEANLDRMIALTEAAGVPMLVMQPPRNLADCPPFKSEFSPATTDSQRQQIIDLLQRSADSAEELRVQSLTEAVALDGTYALSHYLLGRALESLGEYQQAAAAFQEAIDNDVCPLRMTTALQQAMQSAVKRQEAAFLDLHQLICDLSEHGLPDNRMLVDHIHPSFVGHERVAFAILQWMETAGLTPPLPADASAQCRKLWDDSIQQLDRLYFLRGQRALRDLQGWAAGRVNEPPSVAPQHGAEETPPPDE